MASHWPRLFSLLDIFRNLFIWMGWLSRRFGNLLRVAFPPDPLHLDQFTDWRQSVDRIAAPFVAFIARAKSHAHYLGGRFKLLRSPLLAV